MKTVNKIEAVTERDIDLLLLEELNVSDEFAVWVYSKVTGRDDNASCEGAWHSISDAALGESDLIAIYDNDHAILLENKIDANAQHEQGKRYRERGEKGIISELWASYSTCMVAPNLYLSKEKDSQVYDSTLGYEDLVGWFLSSNNLSRRSKYKAYLIKEAIEQNRRGYTVNPDERVTDFWFKYWEFSVINYPKLEMKKPGIKPANSDWPDFRPSFHDKRFSIVHKLERGDVDLQISAAAGELELIQEMVSDMKVKVAKAGKSAAVRLKVGSIDRFASFESQKNLAIQGMEAALKLAEIGRELENRI